MLQILFKKGALNRYTIEKTTNTPLDTLAYFLIGDAFQAIKFAESGFEEISFINWLFDQNSENDWIGGSAMELLKKDGEILLDYQFRNDDEDWSKAFVTSPEDMIMILKQWYDILEMRPRPDEVKLTQEGDDVWQLISQISK